MSASVVEIYLGFMVGFFGGACVAYFVLKPDIVRLRERIDIITKSRDDWRDVSIINKQVAAQLRHHVRCLVGILGDDDD